MLYFPSARAPIDQGLIAVGGDFSVEVLKEAYQKGIFPWPQEGYPILWFSPDPRGVLDFKDFHVAESLKKFAKKNSHWEFTINEAFQRVVHECRLQARPDQKGTWILPEMEDAYAELWDEGLALSLEVWDGEDLIGGIYGVHMSGLFSGESMFHHQSNASKMALWKLVEHLKALGHRWMDIQMVTPLLESFGGKYISRDEFLTRKGL
jgi:leucyl/phenylalanyl-tRNA--protein transferase